MLRQIIIITVTGNSVYNIQGEKYSWWNRRLTRSFLSICVHRLILCFWAYVYIDWSFAFEHWMPWVSRFKHNMPTNLMFVIRMDDVERLVSSHDAYRERMDVLSKLNGNVHDIFITGLACGRWVISQSIDSIWHNWLMYTMQMQTWVWPSTGC